MKRHLLVLAVTLSVFLCGPRISLLQPAHALERGAGITQEALPDELRGVEIQRSFVASAAREVGSIETLTGSVIVAHGNGTQAYFALPGDTIYEKDRVFTLVDSRCRLKFIDNNAIAMGADTDIRIDEIVRNLGLAEKKSHFFMKKGKAMFYALKTLRYRKTTMEVRTPTAVAGVRGTKFGIEVGEERKGSLASRPIYLADASESGWLRLAQNARDGSTTYIFVFNGQVYAVSYTHLTLPTN